MRKYRYRFGDSDDWLNPHDNYAGSLDDIYNAWAWAPIYKDDFCFVYRNGELMLTIDLNNFYKGLNIGGGITPHLVHLVETAIKEHDQATAI